MIGATFCSGIGAPEMAAPWVDWRFASEIAPFPREVLQQRFGYTIPADHNQGAPLLWDDMAEVTPDLLRSRGIPLPDLIVAGTPCQAFSVAGARKGLADKRGNLTLTFVEILHAIADARPDGKLAVLWENVPGVLSDKGNAFGCFLGGLVGAVDALPCPADGSWPSEGMVEGPRARAAWCVLDAQWFGVAQRRRRVFVVIDFGNCVDPAAVLLEPDRLRGNSAPRREAGQVAPTIPARSSGGGGLGTDFDCDGGLITSTGDVAHCLNAGGMGRQDYETETMAAQMEVGDDCAFTLRASEGGGDKAHVFAPIAFAENQRGEIRTSETMQQLTCGGGKPGQGYPAIAFQERGRDGGRSLEYQEDVAYALTAPSGGGRAQERNIALPWAVRRLTPAECEKLQGFPVGHTAVIARGKPAADGPRYKSIGNSMAVPVIAHILSRVRISMEDMA